MARMKTRALLSILCIVISSSATGEDAEAVARRLRDAALADSEAWNAVRDLTTRFGARPAGSPAERAAAEWAAAKMKAMGLANVRVESFPLVAWKRGVERVEVLGDVPQTLAATSLGGTDPTPGAGVEGEVVIFKTLDDLRAAAPGSLAGKIAMLDYQMPRLETGEGYNVATLGRYEGPTESAKRGAVGYVMRSAGTGSRRLPHTGSTSLQNGRVPLPSFAVSAPDADQLARLAAIGPVRLRLFSTGQRVPGASSQNVIGEIPGTNPNEIIVIGAHLDSWDLGTGAIDDGAGIGVILGVAKLLHAQPQKPRRTIRVVLFGAEEVNQPAEPAVIIGGNVFASAYERDLARFALASECDLGAGRVLGLSLPGDWANSELRHNRRARAAAPRRARRRHARAARRRGHVPAAAQRRAGVSAPPGRDALLRSASHRGRHARQDRSCRVAASRRGVGVVCLVVSGVGQRFSKTAPCHSERSEESPDSGDSSPSSRLGMTVSIHR